MVLYITHFTAGKVEIDSFQVSLPAVSDFNQFVEAWKRWQIGTCKLTGNTVFFVWRKFNRTNRYNLQIFRGNGIYFFRITVSSNFKTGIITT